jgi:putative DNA methylase
MTTDHPVVSPKKLIEVALPLDAINASAGAEKNNPFLKGHPRSIHTWWARQPLTGARAIIFSQLVNDPEDLWWHQNPGAVPNAQVRGHWTKARQRLFEIIEDLVLWQNTTNEQVLNRARDAIRDSWRQTCELNKNHPQAAELFNRDKMPGLHDPFAGGGAIPLEAQRLGLEAYASDLNPVAVVINKAMLEIPYRFSGKPPVHPLASQDSPLVSKEWRGADGLSEDIRRYGQWMRESAESRISHLYPQVEITKEIAHNRPDLKPLIGEKVAVIAWLWARTVQSPNPAFRDIAVPLATTFVLSTREGKEVYVEPVVDDRSYAFQVTLGKPPLKAKSGTKAARGANFRCLLSETPIESDYIKAEATAGRMGARLMAIVAEGAKGKVYLPPLPQQEALAMSVQLEDAAKMIHVGLADDPRNLWCLQYGLTHFDHLFTPRQLKALTTLSDLVGEVQEQIYADAISAGLPDDQRGLENEGFGARAYAEAISTYLGVATSRWADFSNTICSWNETNQNVRVLFARQAIPMSWDFVELSPFSCVGPWYGIVEAISDALPQVAGHCAPGTAAQQDAAQQEISRGRFVSTDPPYYDNIAYAELSDFFYVWLRRSLKTAFPKLLATIAVPKSEELVATPYRHGSKAKAEEFFLDGMTSAMRGLASQSHPAAPITIYYAFKQSDSGGEGTNSSGWETFLGAVLKSGLSLTGTWPMRTNKQGRAVANGTNALASAIILVCRPRPKNAGTISRRQFIRFLNEALPPALDAMTRVGEGDHTPVAPVDLSQAIIGPGMAIFSRYDAVLEADGTPMTVKTALQLINRFLAEDDFDADTQFCLHWFDQHGWDIGKFGEADTLARAKGTSVDGVKQAGVVEAGGGNVRLLRSKEYPSDWDAKCDNRLPVWEALHQLIRVYSSRGDTGAAKVLKAVSSQSEAARQLAYRLYTLCERKGWAEDARAYNELVTGWSGIEQATGNVASGQQRDLFDT